MMKHKNIFSTLKLKYSCRFDSVIPAQAGIQGDFCDLAPRLRGGDKQTNSFTFPGLIFSLLFLSLPLFYACSSCSDEDGSLVSKSDNLIACTVAQMETATREVLGEFGKPRALKLELKVLTEEQMLDQAADCDILIGLDSDNVKILSDKGKWSLRGWLDDEIVVAIKSGEKFDIKRAKDMQQPIINPIAIPAANTPAGKKARELLDFWRIHDKVRPRLIEAPDAWQALQMLQSGRARAAITHARLLRRQKGLDIALALGRGRQHNLSRAVMIAPRSLDNGDALELARFVMGEGNKIFAGHGWKRFTSKRLPQR